MPELSHLLSTSKALSVMHAKAHSLDCQIVWGGLYQEKAALSTGESMEQFFSYLAKCGLTTKNMNAAARIDSLTEHTAFWNRRKIDNLAFSLSKQYKKTVKKLKETEDGMNSLQVDFSVNIDEAQIQDWERELRRNARGSLQQRSSTTIVESLEEYYKLYNELEDASSLQTFIANSSEARSIITGHDDMYQLIVSSNKDTTAKRRRLEQLETQLASKGYNKDNILNDGKQLSANNALAILQTRIVHIYLNVQQLQLEISRLADTSKKRTKLRRKVSSTVVLLNTTVEKYNKVAQLLQVRTLDPNDVKAGKFSWKDQEDLEAGCTVAQVVSELVMDSFSIAKKESFLRCLENEVLHSLLKGVLSLKKKGTVAYKRKLSASAELFQKAVGEAPEFFMDIDEGVDEDVDDDLEEDPVDEENDGLNDDSIDAVVDSVIFT
eukprot:gene6503-11960_t